jgi:DNA-binding Lrp family transcriptional regulator
MKDIDQTSMQELADVHAILIQKLLETGRLPEARHIATSLNITPSELTERLNRLSDLHGLVLHPRAPEPRA